MKIWGNEGRRDDFLKKEQAQNVIKNTRENLVRYVGYDVLNVYTHFIVTFDFAL